ncbi:MAG: hypothetical protein OXG88_07400, partial [Gammaproteobacteria bacterium]|nr:hypothetical protein [Gammaproteobacteria bacterium]
QRRFRGTATLCRIITELNSETSFKRQWYGSHHHYSTAYTPLYVAEGCYKYNHREIDMFTKFIKDSMKF